MKVANLAMLAILVLFFTAVPAMAQSPGTSYSLAGAAVGAGLGAGLTIIGAGFGFGRIGASALESMARQPDVATNIQTAMLIIAALLEGATFFSLIVCILVNTKAIF
jgi:F-type H+-transporting ATPase subunit c